MPLTIHQFPCLSDNYGFLIRDDATGRTACIDTPDATAILRELKALGWGLDLILNTHWHPDHAGGNAEVKAATGATVVGPREVERIAAPDRVVEDGDVVELGDTRFEVLDTGGHTLGHVSYFDAADNIAFVGDTLFALGCGRLFEGTAQQMWTSLQKLAALPDATTVYCAHEYTAANARFALSVDDGAAVKARADAIFAARERGEATVPTTIALEKASNPFLRAPLLRPDIADPAEAFGAVRAAKDSFKGMNPAAGEIIARLGMQAHPEGGWYVETFRDVALVDDRPASTAIYYLLEAGQQSAWHRVDAVETWHFHDGAPLTLRRSPPEGGTAETLTLGRDLTAGERPQIVIPKLWWQAARSLGDWTLVGCTVAPGFRFEGFELAPLGWEPDHP